MNSYANTAPAVRIPFWRKDESFAFLTAELKHLFSNSKRFENLIMHAALAYRQGKPIIVEAKHAAKQVVEKFVREFAFAKLTYPEVVTLSFWSKKDDPKQVLTRV